MVYCTWSDPSKGKHIKQAVLLLLCPTDVSVCASRLIQEEEGHPSRKFPKDHPWWREGVHYANCRKIIVQYAHRQLHMCALC